MDDKTETGAPGWWTERHATAWERVKEAFHRDWAQTKSDFSAGEAKNLNQGIGDTVQQAMGSAPLPPPDIKTHRTEPQVAARDASRALDHYVDVTKREDAREMKANAAVAEDRARLTVKISDIQEDVARAKADGDKRIFDATRLADDYLQKQGEKVAEGGAKRTEAESAWRRAEREARYGFAARMEHPQEAWGDALDRTLRADWEAMGDNAPWEASRPGVRSGWEYARGIR